MAISNSVLRNFHDVGSGAVIIISMSVVVIALICMGQSIGWGPTWLRSASRRCRRLSRMPQDEDKSWSYHLTGSNRI